MSTDAEFRTWGGGVSAAIAAVGLVKTADTGQINWTTVLTPPGASTYQGYEIWRFNDSVQATAPIFFKLEYGSGSTTGRPAFRLTVGKGSDGAGTLTSVLLPATVIAAGGTSSTASNWHISSGDGSMIGVAPAVGFFNSLSLPLFFAVERSRNNAGAATGTSVMVATSLGSVAPVVKMINYAIGYTVTPSSFPAAVPTGASTPGVGAGGNTPLFTGICTDGMGNFWQPRSFLVGHSAEIGQLTQMTVPGYGVYLFHTGFGLFSSHALAQHCGAMAWF